MAFKLKSGNVSTFKNLGSSPAKHYVDDNREHNIPKHSDDLQTPKEHKTGKVESPVKQYKKPTGPRAEVKPEETLVKPMTNEEMGKAHDISARITEGSIETQALRRKENKKQATSKAKMKAIDKLMKSPAKQSFDLNLSKKSGFGPSTAFGGVKNRELVKDKKKPTSKKVMKDGKKTQVVHKGKELKGNWQPHQFKSPVKQYKGSGHGPATKFDKKRYPVGNPELTNKNPFKGNSAHGQGSDFIKEAKADAKRGADKYYYKIDGKAVSKTKYVKYKNKPGNMEDGGKQTNNPDVYGRKKGGSPSNPK